MALSAYYFFLKQYRESAKCLAVLVLSAGCAFSYLMLNRILSGYATGIPRHPSVETNLELTLGLLKAQLIELNLIMPFVGDSLLSKSLFFATSVILFVFYITAILFIIKESSNSINKKNNKILWSCS
jgi:hypothetical protein